GLESLLSSCVVGVFTWGRRAMSPRGRLVMACRHRSPVRSVNCISSHPVVVPEARVKTGCEQALDLHEPRPRLRFATITLRDLARIPAYPLRSRVRRHTSSSFTYRSCDQRNFPYEQVC